MNFIVLFGFISLFGYSIFINIEYISLSTIPVVVYTNLKIDKKTILITKVNLVCIVESLKLMVIHIYR
jgi:hypothetical protein